MNVQYFQAEFVGVVGIRKQIAPNAAIPFDTLINESVTGSISDLEFVTEEINDVEVPNGEIKFNKPGVFFINWYVAQQTGLSGNGANFSIVVSNDIANSIYGTSNAKISGTSGFGIVSVVAGDTVSLINASTNNATLSEHTQVKAGIAIFSINAETFVPDPLGYGHSQMTSTESMNPFTSGSSILFGQPIKYDPYDIVTYEETGDSVEGFSGVFTLNNKGTYLVTWDIPILGTDVHDECYVEVIFDGATIVYSYLPLPIGVISGSALIVHNSETASPELSFNIIHINDPQNENDDLIQFGYNANVVITQISHQTDDPSVPTDEG